MNIMNKPWIIWQDIISNIATTINYDIISINDWIVDLYINVILKENLLVIPYNNISMNNSQLIKH